MLCSFHLFHISDTLNVWYNYVIIYSSSFDCQVFSTLISYPLSILTYIHCAHLA